LKKQTIIYFTNDDPPSVLNDLAVNRSLEDWQAGGGFAFSAVACCLLPIAYCLWFTNESINEVTFSACLI